LIRGETETGKDLVARDRHYNGDRSSKPYIPVNCAALNVVIVNLPPLRERADDIGLLAFHFLKQYSTQNKKHIDKISSGALKLLENYYWPGNVR